VQGAGYTPEVTTPPREAYLDANASEPLRPEAARAVAHALTLGLGNPSSGHAAGRRARAVLAEAREAVAVLVGASPAEVVLTSGATEANVLALRGRLACDAAGRPSGVVLTRAEHPSLVRLAERLALEGIDVRFGPVGPAGIVDPDALAEITPAAGVVCLGAAQSVTGAVQDVARLAAILGRQSGAGVSRAAGGGAASIHCDATQAIGRVPFALAMSGASTLALSGHKFGAPAGIGALVVAAGVRWRAPHGDGAQELGRRPGTEAALLAAGLAAAARCAAADVAARAQRDAAARRDILDGVRALGGDVLAPLYDERAITRGASFLPNTALVRFDGCPGDALLAALDALGVRVSAGTACTSLARTAPEVLIAAGIAPAAAAGAIRVSLSWSTIPADVEALLGALAAAVPRARRAFSDRTSRLDVS
jgi:cysteine desulfurase